MDLESEDDGEPPFPTQTSSFPSVPGANPFRVVDQGNEWLKDNTYVDMFGWKDAAKNARSAVKQVMLIGIWGKAYLTRTQDGREAVVFKSQPGFRARLSGLFLRNNPIVKAAGFVIGSREMLEEAGRGVKIAVVALVAWDIVHELLQDKFDMTRLGVTILSDIFQAVAATYVGVTVVTILSVFVAFPVIVSFCIVAGASFLAGMGFSWLDHTYGLTTKAILYVKKLENSRVGHQVTEYVGHKFNEYTESVDRLYVKFFPRLSH